MTRRDLLGALAAVSLPAKGQMSTLGVRESPRQGVGIALQCVPYGRRRASRGPPPR